jgi:UDP-2,4-diacetamido-2,4,6-trideoxy-beta-L-altropyranose hydrolase
MISALFRVDASQQIGAGHLMRCLALADHLREKGGSATFLSRSLSDENRELLASRKHSVLEIAGAANAEPRLIRSALFHSAWLPWSEGEDAHKCTLLLVNRRFDWLVMDHYALAVDWERAMRRAARRVMVIDDLADRDHDCDLLLDQNFGRMASHYEKRVSESTRLLIGPQYALLRPEFAEQRALSLSRREVPDAAPSLLISLGAVDKNNHTASVLRSLANVGLPSNTKIVVVLGANAPHIASVHAEAACSPWSTEVLVNVADMAKLMSKATWAIGAAGTSAWERCCLGLPTLTLVIADNQLPAARALSEAGYVVLVDPLLPLDVSIPWGTDKLVSLARQLSRRCANVTDGRGVERAFEVMKELATE